jgi:hypothetical protein
MTTPSAPEGLTRRPRSLVVARVARKAVSFALVGVVNVAVDFSVFSFAYFYLNGRSSPPMWWPG